MPPALSFVRHLFLLTLFVLLSSAILAQSPNSAPTDITLSYASVPENQFNTAFGLLTTVDADPGDTHTYTKVAGAGDDQNSAFTIVGNVVTLLNSGDFETRSSMTLRVQTSDGQGGTFSKAFVVTITNVNEAPSFTKGADQIHAPGTTTTQTIPNWARNIDDGDSTVTQTLTFSATNNNNALFSVQPSVASDGTLSYTPSGISGVASVAVTLTDDGTINGNAPLSLTQTFTIKVAAEPEIAIEDSTGTDLPATILLEDPPLTTPVGLDHVVSMPWASDSPWWPSRTDR